MKKTIFLLGTLLITSVTFAQTTASTTAQEPQALASAFFKALEKEDAAAIATITTDDFAIINFDGQTADRDLLGQALGGGYLIVETAPTNNLRSRTYNSTTAIVTGESTFKGSVQGNNFNNNVVFTMTCVKMANGWKIASAQLSGSATK
ncbi:MAG TPA: nuclear transport factor 2 family protein [Fibrella sp.]|jgi:ketosteroid isomerase-like protein